MRWIRYEAEGKAHYGILDGEEIAEVTGDPFDGYVATKTRRRLNAVKILVPVPNPPNFYAAGLNYPEHVREMAHKKGEAPKLPEAADIGYRSANALIAQGETIVIPADATEKVQYEGEIVVVIGKTAKNLTEENALDCVLGYTIGNDVSERNWQQNDRTLWRGKNTDTFKPMGPWIETDVDLDAAMTTVRLNGKEEITFPTNSMIFGIRTFLARMSKYLTLHPRDIVWMGTEGATGNIKHGDVVEVEITGLGLLRNPVIREGQ